MKHKKLIAIAFSDLHKGEFKSYNYIDRLELSDVALHRIYGHAHLAGVPVLFAGDFFDNNKTLSNDILVNFATKTKDILNTARTYAIDGNHDFSKKNSYNKPVKGYGKFISRMVDNYHNINFRMVVEENFVVCGIPYIDGNADFQEALDYLAEQAEKRAKGKPVILLIHTDLPGAKDTNGIVVNSDENISAQFSKLPKIFNLILSGHIHRPQKLSKRLYMLGATNHLRVSDRGCDMGYWLIYEDMSTKFVKLELPEFKYPGDEVNEGDFIIEDVEKAVKEEQEDIEQAFHKNMSSKKLVKKYLKEKGIKDKTKKNFLIKVLDQAR
jgi:DNA repair exonuclease SbcCD nuclease subunit